MLNGKKLMCLTLLPTFLCGTLTPPPSTAMQIVEKQVDINNEVHIQNGLIKEQIEIQFEKDKIEYEKRKAEELRQQELKRLEEEKELEEQKKNEHQWQDFELTFYSSLPEENSGSGTKSVTCTGGQLYEGIVASNYYKLNTRIQLEGWGEVTIGDRGSDKYFNNDYRLDVYIPKEPNESNTHYFNRVNNMGRVTLKGYIIK